MRDNMLKPAASSQRQAQQNRQRGETAGCACLGRRAQQGMSAVSCGGARTRRPGRSAAASRRRRASADHRMRPRSAGIPPISSGRPVKFAGVPLLGSS